VLEEAVLSLHDEAIRALKAEGVDYWSARVQDDVLNETDDNKTCNTVIFYSPTDAQLLKCHSLKELVRDFGSSATQQSPMESYNTLFGNTAFFKDHVSIQKEYLTSSSQDNSTCVSFRSGSPVLSPDKGSCKTAISPGSQVPNSAAYHRRNVSFIDASQISMPSSRADIHSLLSKCLICSTCTLSGDGDDAKNRKRCTTINGESNGTKRAGTGDDTSKKTGMLIGCHCKSPWNANYNWKGHCSVTGKDIISRDIEALSDTAIAILFPARNEASPSADGSDRNSESAELSHATKFEVPNDVLLQFRVGDISPSFYLHCCLPVALNDSSDIFEQLQNTLSGTSENTYTPAGTNPNTLYWLFVYRQNPPRCHLQRQEEDLKSLIDDHQLSPASTVHRAVSTNADKKQTEGSSNKTVLRESVLWEVTCVKSPTATTAPIESVVDAEEKSLVRDEAEITEQVVMREVAPPYLVEWRQHYGSLLDHMLQPSGFQAMREEVKAIPQWTPWPEQSHYDVDGGSDWTVFPLCHTFPASDPLKRKWIQTTCAFCPRTVEMLCRLGDSLRTALFSRLGPGTLLSPHMGWQDLANHVVRVHIPLVVPPGGYCGTWVDGCAMLHEEGVMQVFDDSKVHRAFNHSDEERLVLILDLERPAVLPTGTAVGGHTEELDAFIKDMI
jgi:hypothetical protein